MAKLVLHEDRLFPADQRTREIARELYASVRDLPIISPHGHTEPAWFALNLPFSNATELLLRPDHYLLRMLYSQSVPLEQLGIGVEGELPLSTARSAWRIFAQHYYLFRGTPSALWLDHVFANVFQLDVAFEGATADHYFDAITSALQTQAFLPRVLFKKFNIEALATTEGSLNSLEHHAALSRGDWRGRVIPTYRPDDTADPEAPGFAARLDRLGALTGENTRTWQGYLAAHRQRRAFFKSLGATATDHGHPTALTADLAPAEAELLFARVLASNASEADCELFRAQMITEMARMSLDDGLVLQFHPGALRNHNPEVFRKFGPNMGADIPQRTDYVRGLKPLLDRFGNEPNLSIIVFTLDKSTYSRELAPLAGHYPALRLGPAWWFHDSPEGIKRFREQTIETAGFYNTVGFNDDARSFVSIPARHDVARRVDSAYLARLVVEHRMSMSDAASVVADLAYHLPKRAYNLDADTRVARLA